jgi:formylglycine-generating enzyme required for sulfatase activity
MIVIRPGRFLMGAPANEAHSTASERPQHVVSITKKFAVAVFPVTFSQWDACFRDNICRFRPPNPGLAAVGFPVLGILWEEAQEYVWWLSRKTGKKYRLLSESEREYVSRAGTNSAYWWGERFNSLKANTDSDRPVQIDANGPNPWGLYQLNGNVAEWVEDCWNDNYDGAPTDGSVWRTGNCAGHVLRGGGYSRKPWTARSAARNWFGPPNRLNYMSLRVARSLRR